MEAEILSRGEQVNFERRTVDDFSGDRVGISVRIPEHKSRRPFAYRVARARSRRYFDNVRFVQLGVNEAAIIYDMGSRTRIHHKAQAIVDRLLQRIWGRPGVQANGELISWRGLDEGRKPEEDPGGRVAMVEKGRRMPVARTAPRGPACTAAVFTWQVIPGGCAGALRVDAERCSRSVHARNNAAAVAREQSTAVHLLWFRARMVVRT